MDMTGPVVFEATLAVDEFEVGTTVRGDQYVTMRDVTVTTEYETVQKTVLAFGDPSERVASALREGRPLRVMVHESGRVMKVDEVLSDLAA